MIGTGIKFDRPIRRQLKRAFEKYELEVGVLDNRPRRAAKAGSRKTFAGGPARAAGGRQAGTSTTAVAARLRKRAGNFLTAPFRAVASRDVRAFVLAIMKFSVGRGTRAAVEKALRDAVVNPILRSKYGRNTRETAKKKGFNRFMIDTGQTVRAIRARVRQVRRVP